MLNVSIKTPYAYVNKCSKIELFAIY